MNAQRRGVLAPSSFLCKSDGEASLFFSHPVLLLQLALTSRTQWQSDTSTVGIVFENRGEFNLILESPQTV